MKISKHLLQFIFIGFYFLSAGQAYAVTYYCEPTKKSHPKMKEEEYAEDYFEKYKISSKLEESEGKAFITRCSFEAILGKESCHRLEIDKIVQSKVFRGEGGSMTGPMKWVHIKKYYHFNGQFDFQIFPDLSFVENDGRKGMSFGKCKVISP